MASRADDFNPERKDVTSFGGDPVQDICRKEKGINRMAPDPVSQWTDGAAGAHVE